MGDEEIETMSSSFPLRFDDARLVSCSKGKSLMEVLLPRLKPYYKTVPSELTSSRTLPLSTL